mgnify:CR=1 FL=1
MVHKKRVVFVAAYSPEENLAGAKKIETIIGTEVFDRQDRFGLTRQGKILLSYADQSMNLYEKLFEDLERANTKEKVSIAISCIILLFHGS